MKLNFIFRALTLTVIFVTSGAAIFAQQTPATPNTKATREKIVKIPKVETPVKSEDVQASADSMTNAPTDKVETPVVKIETPKVVITDTTKIVTPATKEASEPAKPAISEEEAAIMPYYSSFFTNYTLGPEDIISVEVFGQCPNYCKLNITIPPTGRISYPLIREGVSVRGKSVEQIQDEIAKKLNEYIIDPQVTVSLDKAVSSRYSILGDIAKPGVQTMSRRISILEAIAESGGIAQTGNTKQVVVLRANANNQLTPIPVSLREMQLGKTEIFYLQPGDQIIVSGNKFKTIDKFTRYASLISFARLFTGSGF